MSDQFRELYEEVGSLIKTVKDQAALIDNLNGRLEELEHNEIYHNQTVCNCGGLNN